MNVGNSEKHANGPILKIPKKKTILPFYIKCTRGLQCVFNDNKDCIFRQPREVYSAICAAVQKRNLSVLSLHGWKVKVCIVYQEQHLIIQHYTNIS